MWPGCPNRSRKRSNKFRGRRRRRAGDARRPRDAGSYDGIPPDEKNRTAGGSDGPALAARESVRRGRRVRPQEAAYPETVTVGATHPELGLFSNESLGGLGRFLPALVERIRLTAATSTQIVASMGPTSGSAWRP